MSKIMYDKLIRDNIPKIIEKAGKTCVVEKVEGDVYLNYLLKKLFEEAEELKEDKNIEELADVMEVAESIRKALGIETKDLLELMEKKRKKNGGFEKGLVLKEVK